MGTALGNLVKYTNVEKLTQDIKDNQQAMQNLGSTELNAYIKAFQDGKITLEQFTSAVKGLTNTQKDSANATHQQATELDQLKDRAKHFLSLANGV
jgi:Glu-tRNA(Gln) amidotransferase subunit E-like FAD-binding protein